MVNTQLGLFEKSEQKPERIWRQLPEESRLRIAELFAAVLLEHIVSRTHGADDGVASER